MKISGRRVPDDIHARLIAAIDSAIASDHDAIRGNFVGHFGVARMKQATFDKCVARGGPNFSWRYARAICAAIGIDYDKLASPAKEVDNIIETVAETCDYRCAQFHALNNSTSRTGIQKNARIFATAMLVGSYAMYVKSLGNIVKTYGARLSECSCGATHFEVVEYPPQDTHPMNGKGFAITVSNRLHIYFIEEARHFNLTLSLPNDRDRRPLVGIMTRGSVAAHKLMLVPHNSQAQLDLTKEKIERLLNNDPNAEDGILLAQRDWI